MGADWLIDRIPLPAVPNEFVTANRLLVVTTHLTLLVLSAAVLATSSPLLHAA